MSIFVLLYYIVSYYSSSQRRKQLVLQISFTSVLTYLLYYVIAVYFLIFSPVF